MLYTYVPKKGIVEGRTRGENLDCAFLGNNLAAYGIRTRDRTVAENTTDHLISTTLIPSEKSMEWPLGGGK